MARPLMTRLGFPVSRSGARFRTHEDVRDAIRRACADHAELAAFHDLGVSEEGRPLYGVVIGNGPRMGSLIAGAHSDEPVGPETLRTFILEGLSRREELEQVFAAFRFVIVPHVNPDGEARNQPWIRRWPDVEAYIQHVFRELPGRDVEFGFPDMRVENRMVSGFLQKHGPYALHMSLHGMGFSEGAMLLIERHWAFRTGALRNAFTASVHEVGLGLHDHNRHGEKGFFYIAPGYTTTPEGEMMRAYFRARGDEETASKFHFSSMEFVRSLGGDPLCLVTELPLFVVPNEIPEPGYPARYLSFQERLPEIKLKLERGQGIGDVLTEFRIQALDLGTAMALQLRAIELGLAEVAAS